jgi:hypothetical protein
VVLVLVLGPVWGLAGGTLEDALLLGNRRHFLELLCHFLFFISLLLFFYLDYMSFVNGVGYSACIGTFLFCLPGGGWMEGW